MDDFPLVSIRIRYPTGFVFRAGHLTPYFAESVAGELRRATGRVQRDAAALETVRGRLATLGGGEVRIVYRRRPLRPAA